MATQTLRQKLQKFRNDDDLRAQFEDLVRAANLPDILWPERHPRAFPAKFRAKERGRDVVYPLKDVRERLEYVAIFIEELSRHTRSHPAVAFLYLTLFQEEYRADPKKKRGTSARAKEREKERKSIYDKVSRLKRRLVVSKAVKRARNRHELSRAVLDEFDKLTLEYYRQREQKQSLEIELEMHRKTLGRHAEDRKRIDELVAENANLGVRLAREKDRSRSIEQELGRLADQMMTGGAVASDSALAAEYKALRHEYSVLSQKYDAIVSKNIELSNRVEQVGKARALEQILNSIRDRINNVLRSGLIENDEALLSVIQNEIAELQRARIYLGRALYDVGMLYLRSGDRKRALAELRAARELGVDGAETNRIIGSLT